MTKAGNLWTNLVLHHDHKDVCATKRQLWESFDRHNSISFAGEVQHGRRGRAHLHHSTIVLSIKECYHKIIMQAYRRQTNQFLTKKIEVVRECN